MCYLAHVRGVTERETARESVQICLEQARNRGNRLFCIKRSKFPLRKPRKPQTEDPRRKRSPIFGRTCVHSLRSSGKITSFI